MEYVEIIVTSRDQTGSGAVGRMRREGNIPAVLYGMGRPNMNLTVRSVDFDRLFKSGSRLVHLRMGDNVRSAILRDLQINALTDGLLHADFTRVSDDVEIEDSCSITFKGRAKGTTEGGNFQVLRETVQVRALPRNLPGSLIVDITELAVGDVIRAGELPFSEGVTLLTQETDLLCHVTAEVEAAEEEEEVEVAPVEDAAT